MTVSIPAVHIPLAAANWPTAVEWRRLGDLCEGIFDCPHTTPVLTASGPYLARSQDVRTGTFRLDQARHVSEETYLERIDRAEPQHGDLLFSREGTYFGNAAEVPPATKVCLGQRMVLIRPKRSELNPTFLKYWLNSSVMAAHIAGFKDGSVAERLNMPTIRALPVPRLDRNRQAQIATILGALDDKIELNRRMNETLETMARAIFKDWFIDFGPTRAKMEGREPYLAPDVWSLFPDRLDNEGKPGGWGIRRVSDLLELVYGKSLPASERIPGLYPVYGSGGITGTHNSPFAKGPSVIVGRKGTVGSLYWEDGSFFPIDTVFFVRTEYSLAFCFYHLETLGLSSMNTDAAVPGLNRENVYRLPVPWSSDQVRQAFDEIASPIRRKIRLNNIEAENLAATRDLLLPKLMSGEIRIKDAEKLAGEAT